LNDTVEDNFGVGSLIFYSFNKLSESGIFILNLSNIIFSALVNCLGLV